MRLASVFLTLLILISLMGGCAVTTEPPAEEAPVETPGDGSGLNTVEDDGSEEDEAQEPYEDYLADERETAMSEGGSVVKLGDRVAYASAGGIYVASLSENKVECISPDTPERLFFDGESVFYMTGDGIYRAGAGREAIRLSEDRAYSMAIDQQRIYYVKQTDGEAQGELWAMDKEGGSAVVILPEEIRGEFKIRNGWLHYISAEDGGLYRVMLFGSEAVLLAERPGEMCLVTDKAMYYRSDDRMRTLYRADLKSGAEVPIGAFGDAVRVGEDVYIMDRRLNNGVAENLFSLSVISARGGESRRLITFENVGDDSFVYYYDGYAYMRSGEGRIYRIDTEDKEQNKQAVFSGRAVFSEGKGYCAADGGLTVYDCQTGESRLIAG